MQDIFKDETGRSRALIGCAVCSGSARLAELAIRVGFDVTWIDMEHASANLATAEALCVATEAAGGIPLIRTMGYQRDHILRALEVGGRIIVVPLVNDAEAAREVVRHGKFRPVGQRGYNTRSRGLRFSVNSNEIALANDRTYLLPQIESLEAVENLDEILAVEGLSGILIGPGDLSADMGRPGQFDDPELCDTVARCIRKALDAGLHAGSFSASPSLTDAIFDAGADLCIVASDFTDLIPVWRARLARFEQLLTGQRAKNKDQASHAK